MALWTSRAMSGEMTPRPGKSPSALDPGHTAVHPHLTPDTAKGIRNRMAPIHRKEQELRHLDRKGNGTLGKAPEACSGRTATTLALPAREGPAGRPPARGCRGRTGRRVAFGRRTGPDGRHTRRYRQVGVERRNGSEELTGSPGGYSGPFPRFPDHTGMPTSGLPPGQLRYGT